MHTSQASSSNQMDGPPAGEITIETLNQISEESRELPQSGFVRVPRRQLLDENPKAYIPQYFSLGPGHDSPCQTAQEWKEKYMFSLLKPIADRNTRLSRYKSFITENLEDIISCYDIKSGLEDVGKIVLVDVCFLLELVFRMINLPESCPKSDNMIFLSMRRDASLVENQLPLFAIKGLLDITAKGRNMYSMEDMCVNMLRLVRLTPVYPTQNQIMETFMGADSCPHLLDLVRRYHLVDVTSVMNMCNDRFTLLDSSPRSIQLRSATQLNAAGVKFRRKNGMNLLALEFSDGEFRIPALVLHDSTETLMINLLAYGHLACHVNSDEADAFSSYVMVMMHLVQTPKDLELLQRKGIIINELSSRADGPTIFHNVNKQVFLSVFKFKNLCDQIDAFAYSRLRRYKMSFITSYLKSPWTVISLFAAGFLLCLTVLQTYYSIFSYHKKKT